MTEKHLAADPDAYEGSVDRLRVGLRRARLENLKPPPILRLSQWAARYAVLSAETSAQTGRFRAYAYQIGMMDAVTDPAVSEITVMKSARVGYTKILDHVAGYYIHQDPSPMLLVQPRVEDAEDYSATEIEPMLRDTPVLAEITGDLKAKDSKQKLAKRVFRNGSSISFVGANSPGGFRRITARIIMFDEVDGYPITGAGKEGDQIRLGKRRAQTFWNSKFILGSTPTVKGESRIEKSFLLSDQRRYHVPCPHCGEMQVLEWGGVDTAHGIKWDKDEEGKALTGTAHYVCRVHGCVIEEVEKPRMLDLGEWRAGAPFAGHAGFHIWTGYSLDPKASWKALAAEWIEVEHDPLERQTFINTVLGEAYEDRGERALAEGRLIERCEVYEAEVPTGVGVITCGVDTQPDRLELEVVGWGRNEESWSLAYEVFPGDPNEPEIWERLDRYLRMTWHRADGRPFVVSATCIDSGGANTQAVYNYAKARLARRIYAIKGASEQGGNRMPVWPSKVPRSRNKKSYRPNMIGTNAAKDSIRQRLHTEEPGPGYMHFPDRDLVYFQQLLAARSVRKYGNGRYYHVWEDIPGRNVEALDCRVYAFAALASLQHDGLRLNQRVDDVAAFYVSASGDAARAQPQSTENQATAPVIITPEQPANIITVGETPSPGKGQSLGAMLARRGKP